MRTQYSSMKILNFFRAHQVAASLHIFRLIDKAGQGLSLLLFNLLLALIAFKMRLLINPVQAYFCGIPGPIKMRQVARYI